VARVLPLPDARTFAPAAFAQRGARVVGVDLSGEAIRQARVIAEGSGLNIELVHANVYDTAEALAGPRKHRIESGRPRPSMRECRGHTSSAAPSGA
jgi:hypothetical protein